MIFRLTYCNKFGNQARVEIQKGLATPIFDIEGTGRPFILSYQNDKSDKRGAIRSSSADIEIYETPEFNIDVLKTSNETELSVAYFVDDVVKWKGFIIPDFFSREISGNAVVSMTASDRLGTLKSATLSDLTSMMTLRDLTIACLTKTGLSLSLKTMVDISNGTNNNDFFNSKILTQRLSDTKGRNISCYDVLSSILTASNSFLTQRNGEWYIVNKYQHEIGSGKLYNTATTSTNWSEVIHDFSEITVGGRRTIVPVGSSVGVYQEFGGGRIHPENYDFSQDLTGWNSVGGFVASIDNRKVDTFTTGVSGQAEYKPVYGAVTEKKYLVNFNEYLRNENPIYLESNAIPVFYSGSGSVTVSLDINAIAPAVSSFGSFPPAYLRVAIIATNGTKTKTLDYSGKFIDYPSTNPPVFTSQFDKGEAISPTIYRALSKGMAVSGALEVEDDLSLYSLKIRIYGGGGGRTVLINSVGLTIKSGSKDNPKGTIYKSEQGSNFTKTHDLETSIFGDYLTNGLNGYFYDYPKDDTSSLFNNSGVLTNNWITPTDTEQLPLLQHISRQKARMFSVAHDLLTAEIEVVNFDPLAIFRDCNGKKYTIVTAEVDFFNAKVNLDIEQIIYDGTISRRDFVYSYFGDGEKGVQSIGGVSAGSGDNGLTPGQIDIINNVGGIKEKVDEVTERVNNSRVGVANLLRNTGFLGDFNNLNVDYLTALANNTPIDTNSLAHWTHSDTSVIDAPSRSGKGIRIGSIQQNVKLKAGEPYVLSFWAKGVSLIVGLVDTIQIPLTTEYKRYSFDIVAGETKEYTFILIDNSNTAEVYEIMLSNGNTKASYAYAEEDDVKAISQLQAINTITSAIKEGNTQILGGLILSTMLQLGKYKDGVMEKVTSGMNGIWNSDDDPAIWAGGTFDQAISTVQKFKDNPSYQPTEAEWAEMAKMVITHGGDGFFRGYIYALGGIFRGKVETSVNGNRISIDPATKDIRFINNENEEVLKISFITDRTASIRFNEYYPSGNFKKIVSYSNNIGYEVQEYDEIGGQATPLRYGVDGAITNRKLIDMTDEVADATLVSGQWYRTGRILKVKP